jgi:hypothetical protein
MDGFLQRGNRYLWTDAFAVQNLLRLDDRDRARALVDEVHRTLGKHNGKWLSPEGESRPTLGGLRIGKPLPERGAHERLDRELEWDRDGQYFHYLTKWMSALEAFGDPTLHRWAVDLAKTAHRAFVHDGRMFWKMSVDLTRPLVPSMGQHDPLDGYVTCKSLHDPSLEPELASFRSMIEPAALFTDDPLGLGGLFSDAHRLSEDDPLRARILDAAERGVRFYEPMGPATHRLAFRELGLAIGLLQVERHRKLADEIVGFWLRDQHRSVAAYVEHRDINDVMLATALISQPARLRARLG